MLAVSLFGVYVFAVLLDVDEMFLTQDKSLEKEIPFLIGAQTGQKHFKDFFNFTTETKEYDYWIKEALDSQKIELTDNKIEFLGDVKIKGLYSNHCKRIYCFQNRTEFSKIPSNLWKALIGTEDIRFLEHKGVDLKSILRALYVDIKEMKFVQGGSTITQQLVKNIFLTNEKSLERKLKEVIIAIYIEYSYKKEEILQAYLNEQMWGSLNGIRIMGHQAASLFYFNKSSDKLNEVEATALISMLKGPYYYSPLTNLDRLISRTKAQFDKLVEKDLYYSKKSNFWSDSEWKTWQAELIKRVDSNIFKDIYLTSVKENKINKFEIYTWYRGISYVREILKNKIDDKDFAFKIKRSKLNCLDCKDLNIYSKFEKSLEKGISEERHQIGSIFKPIVYQNFLNEGYKRDRLVSTADIEIQLKSGKWKPRDSESKEAEIPLEQALQQSKNKPFIRLCNEYGFEHIQTYLQILNIPNLKLPLKEYPAQLLGALELSVGEVNRIYTGFIENVCNRVNSEVLEWKNTVFDILSDPTKTTISHIVQKDISRIKFFGKTGTSNNGNDTWFVSFDGSHLTTIWGGVESDKAESKTLISGASSAFRLYQFFVANSARRPRELGCSEISMP